MRLFRSLNSRIPCGISTSIVHWPASFLLAVFIAFFDSPRVIGFKHIFVMMVCTLAALQECHAQLRLYGTNLCDLSEINRNLNQIPLTNMYRVSGIIGQQTDSGILVQRNLGLAYRYIPQTEAASRVLGTRGTLGALAAERIAGKEGRITQGAFFALSPEVQLHFQKEIVSEVVLVTNYVGSAASGGSINLAVLPSGFHQYETVERKTVKVKRFDAGASPGTNSPGSYYKVTLKGTSIHRTQSKNHPPKR